MLNAEQLERLVELAAELTVSDLLTPQYDALLDVARRADALTILVMEVAP